MVYLMEDLKLLVEQHRLQRFVLDEIETEMYCIQDGITKTARDIQECVEYNLDYINERVEHPMEDISDERILGRVDAFKQVLHMLHDNILNEMEKDKI